MLVIFCLFFLLKFLILIIYSFYENPDFKNKKGKHLKGHIKAIKVKFIMLILKVGCQSNKNLLNIKLSNLLLSQSQ